MQEHNAQHSRPLEVSRTAPRFIFGSFSSTFSRIDFRIAKVALWDWDRAREYRVARS